MDRSITISMMWLCTTLLCTVCSVFTERNQFCLVHLQLKSANPSKLHSHQQHRSEQHHFEIASRTLWMPSNSMSSIWGVSRQWPRVSPVGCTSSQPPPVFSFPCARPPPTLARHPLASRRRARLGRRCATLSQLR